MGNPFLSTAPPTVCSLARCVGAFQPIRDACLSFSSTLHAPRWRFGHSNETRHGRSHDHGRRNRRASRVLARARRPRRVLPRVRDPPRAHPRAAPSPRPLRGGTDLVPPPGAHRRARVWRRRGIAPRRARRGRAVPGAPGSAPRVAVQGAPGLPAARMGRPGPPGLPRQARIPGRLFLRRPRVPHRVRILRPANATARGDHLRHHRHVRRHRRHLPPHLQQLELRPGQAAVRNRGVRGDRLVRRAGVRERPGDAREGSTPRHVHRAADRGAPAQDAAGVRRRRLRLPRRAQLHRRARVRRGQARVGTKRRRGILQRALRRHVRAVRDERGGGGGGGGRGVGQVRGGDGQVQAG